MTNIPPLPDRAPPQREFPPSLPASVTDTKQGLPSTADEPRKPAFGILIVCAFVLFICLLSAFAFLLSVLSSSEQHLAESGKVVPSSPLASSPEASSNDNRKASETEGGTESQTGGGAQQDSKPDEATGNASSDPASKTAVVDESQTTKITETKNDSGPGVGVTEDQENPAMESETEKPTDSDQESTSTTQEQEPETPPQSAFASSKPTRVLNTGSVKKTVETEIPAETPMPENSASIPPVNQTEFSDRVEREGGKSGESQITLIWNNLNDLDLHLYCPSNEHIYFQHPNSRCGAALDIDMNAGFGRSNRPVENIVWANRAPASGRYAIWVKHYATQGGRNPTAFQILVKQDGKTRTFRGQLRHNEQRFITYLRVP